MAAALEQAFGALDEACGLPPRSRRARPAEGGWSVDEVLEHVALANRYLLRSIGKAARTAQARSSAQGNELGPARYGERWPLIEATGERSFAWAHPAHMTPSGSADASRVRSELAEQRAELGQLLARLPEGAGALCTRSLDVGRVGRADVYEYAYFVAVHAQRHVRQIARARRAAELA